MGGVSLNILTLITQLHSRGELFHLDEEEDTKENVDDYLFC